MRSLQRAHVRTVAIRAILRRGFVEQDQLALHLTLQGVALRAADICVPPCQWELSAFIVVER